MTEKDINNLNGFSLIETVVAMAMFAMVILGATAIFQSVIEGQRNAIAAQNIQESMRYIFEVMSKEIRNAKLSSATCMGGANYVYNKSVINENDALGFINKNDECVTYYVASNTLMIKRGANPAASTTPAQVKVDGLKFLVDDRLKSSVGSIIQPKVTINLETEFITSKEQNRQKMKMQTTISSRKY